MSQPRCMALTKAGDQCRNRAAHGSDYCPSHGPRVGRPTKLTDGLIDVIARSVESGNAYTTAANTAGVHDRTLYRWLTQADEDLAQDPPADTVHARLRQALTRAEAEAEARMVASVKLATLTDWRAAAWWLERRRPDKYAQRSKVDVGGEVRVGTPEVVVPEEGARERIARILKDAGALGGTAS